MKQSVYKDTRTIEYFKNSSTFRKIETSCGRYNTWRILRVKGELSNLSFAN